MLAEFYGEMVACDEQLHLAWGPRVLIVQEPASKEQRRQTLAEILAVCAAIQNRRGEAKEPPAGE